MSADCSLQVVESQHRSGDLILANDNIQSSLCSLTSRSNNRTFCLTLPPEIDFMMCKR